MKSFTSNQKKIIFATFILQFSAFSVAGNTLPVIQPTLMEYFGIKGSNIPLFSLLYAIGFLSAAIIAPFVPNIFKKIGAKFTYIIGGLLIGVSFIIMHFIPTSLAPENIIYIFWILAGCLNIGGVLIGLIGVPFLITMWIPKNIKGKVLGSIFMASGIGSLSLVSFFNVYKPTGNNISSIVLFIGVLVSILSFVISIAFIKEPDSEEFKNIHNSNEESNQNSLVGNTLKEAVKTKRFYLFLIGLAFIGFYIPAMVTQYPTYFKTTGLIENGDSIYLIIAFAFSFASILGNYLGGMFLDKLGPLKSIMIGGILALTGIVSLILSPKVPELGYLFAVATGLQVYMYIVMPGYIVPYLFGIKEFPKILGIFQMVLFTCLGLGIFIFAFGIKTFGWINTWVLVLFFVIIAYVFLIIAVKMRNK